MRSIISDIYLVLREHRRVLKPAGARWYSIFEIYLFAYSARFNDVSIFDKQAHVCQNITFLRAVQCPVYYHVAR